MKPNILNIIEFYRNLILGKHDGENFILARFAGTY